ncbi:RuvC-like Holliday junction resolvase [Invertebrate iridescent virus 22]|uniref:RuvC-like Holliday junction resolvase n=1 Tax=Invertebrate iridescent virus 22 TaxID=345198 RepID=S6DA76_9VIRU|nr:RuvC-like Holliday junction resolvase [Invertebrate iridescent virus 22]CCV01778.1 RuvC-like Holliday junction resolvase [Invertebrate iridescent virus 22]
MIAAFDLGRKNFAFAVKNKDEFILLQNINLDETSVTKTDLNKLKKDELVNMMANMHIEQPLKIKKKEMVDCILKNKSKTKPKDVGVAMFEVMDNFKDIWDKCNIFLIERQMTINLQALKLSHYLEAYLKIYYPTKKILNYNASKKTKKLGAPNLKTKQDRKKWTIQYASNILCGKNLEYFNNLSKQDDVADVICMIESYN